MMDGLAHKGRYSPWRRFWHKNKYAYLFLSPWLIGLLIWQAFPTVWSLYLSFTDYDLARANWVGPSNYTTMFTDDRRYMRSLSVTFRYVFLGVPLQLFISLMLALILNRKLPGIALFRGVFYLPSLMGGSVAIAIMWRRFFGIDGFFNILLERVGLQDGPAISWVSNPRYALYLLILLLVWQFGSPMIIFLAGLRQIPTDLYEAAAIDGAGSWSLFSRITLPLLTPIIFFNLIQQMISAFQAFTPAYIIGGGGGGSVGGPLDSMLFYTLYLYQKSFVEFRLGYASAMAWILLIIIAVFTALLFTSSRYWVHYGDK